MSSGIYLLLLPKKIFYSMCQTLLNRQAILIIDCQVDVKPQKEPLYTQVVRISIKTCDMTTAALSISKM